jgi:hypothetical protein
MELGTLFGIVVVCGLFLTLIVIAWHRLMARAFASDTDSRRRRRQGRQSSRRDVGSSFEPWDAPGLIHHAGGGSTGPAVGGGAVEHPATSHDADGWGAAAGSNGASDVSGSAGGGGGFEVSGGFDAGASAGGGWDCGGGFDAGGGFGCGE